MKKNKVGRGRGHGQRQLRVEQLERRAMLAGEVTVDVSGGNLIIRGDNADNGVFITQLDDGVYAVVALDDLDGNPTILINKDANNEETDEIIVEGITGDINIDLKKGDDLLAIGNDTGDLEALAEECGFTFGSGSGSGSASESPAAQAIVPEGSQTFVPDDLIIRTGDGNDALLLIVAVNDVADIKTGKGDDVVGVGSSQFGNDLIVLTDKGADEVCVHDTFVEDHLNIQTGDGDDQGVSVEDIEAGHVLILTGKGDDDVIVLGLDIDREVVINTGNDDDVVSVQGGEGASSIGTNLIIETGSGEDSVFAGFLDIDNLLLVITGSGNDPDVELFEFSAQNVVVDTGSGNDGTNDEGSPITIEFASIEDNLTVVTGSGRDLLDIFGVDVFGNLVINTGNDTDAVNLLSLFVEGHATILLGSNSSGPEEFENLLIDNVDVGGNALIDTGSGNDRVDIVNDSSVAGKLTVRMGSGNNDFLFIVDSFASRALFDGGSGNEDTIVDGGGNDFDEEPDVINFENEID